MRTQTLKASKLTAISVSAATLLCLSVSASADPWEPGIGVALNYSPSYDLSGDGGSTPDGDMLGAKINYASTGVYPFRASLKYGNGSVDEGRLEADGQILNLEFGFGFAFESDVFELIPYAGVGAMEADWDFENAGVGKNPQLEHRYLYVPIGFYGGSTAPLDQVNIYYNAHFKPLIAGDVTLEHPSGTEMVMDSGHGFRFETGFHIPSTSTWNVFTGIYFEQWDINSSSQGFQGKGSGPAEVPDYETEEIGINIGVHF